MKRPAVFFDRDNTLIACDDYLGDPSKVALVEGAADAVARARGLGYATVIFSNQSGVARGYYSEEAVHAVNARLDEVLADANPKAVIDRHDFCPFHPDASIDKYRQDSHLRKPRPGMIHQAAEALALDLTRSWVVGDAPRDIEAGKAAGCRTILFADPKLKASPAALAERKVEPDYICSTLAEAIDFIERNTAPREAREAAPVVAASNDQPDPSTSRAGEGGREREARGDSSASSAEVSSPSPSRPADATATARDPKPPAAPAAAATPRPLTSIEKLMAKAAMQAGDNPTTIAPARPAAAAAAAAPSAARPAAAASPEGDAPRAATPASAAKLESIALDILHELRRRHEQPQQDFSVPKLLAGITQVIVLAMLFIAFLNRASPLLNSYLLFALTIQTMTIALLIMGRQR